MGEQYKCADGEWEKVEKPYCMGCGVEMHPTAAHSPFAEEEGGIFCFACVVDANAQRAPGRPLVTVYVPRLVGPPTVAKLARTQGGGYSVTVEGSGAPLAMESRCPSLIAGLSVLAGFAEKCIMIDDEGGNL
jgi:hypothetical protein